MAQIEIIRPLQQPTGDKRLLSILKSTLSNSRYTNFRIIVAYAKSGPLLRLHSELANWNNQKKSISAIIGIDQNGTSYDALLYMLNSFDKTYITQEAGITFHPKIYIFNNDEEYLAIIGSNNLTVGGTEINFEAAVCIECKKENDNPTIIQIEKIWNDLLPESCASTQELEQNLLKTLFDNQIVLSEKTIYRKRKTFSDVKKQMNFKKGITLVPPSALPKKQIIAITERISSIVHGATEASLLNESAQKFVIQIKPHHNGEIFLSVLAAKQYPDFFGWPFTGKTIPKKANNPAYPQKEPDPKVNIIIYGKDYHELLKLSQYSLNTIYYEKKSEIRITASPIVGIAPEYSIMVIELSESNDVDYNIFIHTPESPDYQKWLNSCNQEMPGGGSTPRKYGWF